MSQPSPDSRQTVLVVDDAPEIVSVLGALLEPHYRVRVATSGARALQVAASEPQPDLILLDILMPGMDGYAVLEQLHAHPELRDVPVIFITALDEAENEEHGLALGAVDYIPKPVQPAIVLARVHAHLELKRARDWLKNQNTFLEAEVARRMADNLQIQDVSIRALARLAEVRSIETGKHLLRTQAYVRTLAEHLAADPRFAAVLTPQHIDVIAKSAPLHDIGKVGIPDDILHKPGRLTPDEWEVMKHHAKLGSSAIENAERDAERPIEFLAVAKEIAHFHHERWNGSGYPEGLAGQQIPLSARLMAVADVFDALITRRSYKKALSVEEATRAIVSGRGKLFDPDVVDAFSATRERFAQIARQYADADPV